MKVLCFTQIYPSSRERTRGPYNFHSFRALSTYCEAWVVSPRPWWLRLRRPGELWRPARETIDGLPALYPTYWSIPRFAPGSSAGMMYRSLRPRIARLRRSFPFDAVVAAWAYPDGAAAAMIAKEYGCPLITRVMGSDVNHLGSDPNLRRHVRAALCRAQRVVAVSGALRDRLIDLGVSPERIIVQHNAVDGQRFVLRDRLQVRAQLNLPLDRPIVCYLGRLGHEKGGDVLIEAVGHLKAMGRADVLLMVVGSGKMEAAWRAQVQVAGVEGQVRFVGERPPDEVPLWLSACDLLCLPSRQEGCPNVVLEALASGRPVVASRVGGVPELLDPTNGITVPPEQPAPLAEALCTALSQPWDPQRLRASVAYLSWDEVGQRYRDELAGILQNWPSEQPAGPHAHVSPRKRSEEDQLASNLRGGDQQR